MKKNNDNLNKVDVYEGMEHEDDLTHAAALKGGAAGQTSEQSQAEQTLLQPQIITQQRVAE